MNEDELKGDFALASGNNDDSIKAIDRLLKQGYLNPSVKCLYDIDTEKYHLLYLQTQQLMAIDKKETVRNIAIQNYGKLPKYWANLIPTKRLIFDPLKKEHFILNNIPYQNTFIPTKFFTHRQLDDKSLLDSMNMIDRLDFSKYPHIKALLDNLFLSDERITYFINWLSYIIDTKSKTGTAIILRGIQGTGKGVLWENIIQYLIGEKYTHEISNEALNSRFNGELENKLFVLANEIKGDFRDGNNIYEKLKVYITDPMIRFEDKQIKARMIKNFFNMLIFSNNSTPLQIQGNDRRYTVYETKNRTLKSVSSEDFNYPHIKHFINAVKKERDSFLSDLVIYKYDISLATTPHETEEKEKIYQASMTKIDILADKIINKDLLYFDYHFRDIADINYGDFKELVSNSKAILFAVYQDSNNYEQKDKTLENIIIELNKKLEQAFKEETIENTFLLLLYRLLVSSDSSDKKIGTQLNTYFNKAYVSNGKRYRNLSQDQAIPF